MDVISDQDSTSLPITFTCRQPSCAAHKFARFQGCSCLSDVRLLGVHTVLRNLLVSTVLPAPSKTLNSIQVDAKPQLTKSP